MTELHLPYMSQIISSLQGSNDGVLHSVLFFWTKSVIKYIKIKQAMTFQGLALPPINNIEVTGKKLHNDHTLSEHYTLPIKAIPELLEVCLRTAYCEADESFYQHISSPHESNIYMENFKNLALDMAECKPILSLHCVDDTFVVWPYSLHSERIF